MAMKSPKETGTKPVNPYTASLNGYKHMSGRAGGRRVIDKPKAIRVNGKVVPLPKNALTGATIVKGLKGGPGVKSTPRNPITSVGGYLGKNWTGTKDMNVTGVSTTGQLKVGGSAAKKVSRSVGSNVAKKAGSSAAIASAARKVAKKAVKKSAKIAPANQGQRGGKVAPSKRGIRGTRSK